MKKEKCRKCGGKGYDEIVFTKYKSKTREYKTLCMFCLGHGEVDWVKNVVGPPKVSNALFLISEELSAKLGSYMFSLGNTFIVNEEFLLANEFEEKWNHVLITRKDKIWRIIDDPPD